MSVDPEAPEQAAPDTPTPETQAEIDWRKRYEDLRPEYDRKSQAAADYERLRTGQNPDALKSILDAYGYEVADDEDVQIDEPENPSLDPQLAEIVKQVPELAQWKDQISAMLAEQAFKNDLAEVAGDREVPEQGRDWILNQTSANGNDRDALEKATKAWFDFEDSLTEKATKKRPRAPHVPAGGQPATDTRDTADMSRSELVAYMTDRLRAEEG